MPVNTVTQANIRGHDEGAPTIAPLRIPPVPPLIHHRSSGSSSVTALLSPPDREELLSPPEPGLSSSLLGQSAREGGSYKMGKTGLATDSSYYTSAQHRHSFPQESATPASATSSTFARPWQPSSALSSWSSTSSFGSSVPVRRASSPPRQRESADVRSSGTQYIPSSSTSSATARYSDSGEMVEAMRDVTLMGGSLSTSPQPRHGAPGFATGLGSDSQKSMNSSTLRRTSGPGTGGGRNMMSKLQSTLLHQLWEETYFPTTEQRAEVARAADLSARQVQVWFQNQRQKQRRLLHSPAESAAEMGTGASTSDAEEAAGAASDYRKDLSLDGRAMKANRAAPDETKYRRLWATQSSAPAKSASPTGLARSHSLGEVDHRSSAVGPQRSGAMSTTTSPRARVASVYARTPVIAGQALSKRSLDSREHSFDLDAVTQETMKLPRLEVKPNLNVSGLRLPRLAELDLPQAPGLPPPAHRHAYAQSPDLGPFSL